MTAREGAQIPADEGAAGAHPALPAGDPHGQSHVSILWDARSKFFFWMTRHRKLRAPVPSGSSLGGAISASPSEGVQ